MQADTTSQYSEDSPVPYLLQALGRASCREAWVVYLRPTESAASGDRLTDALWARVEAGDAQLVEDAIEHEPEREIVGSPVQLSQGEARARIDHAKSVRSIPARRRGKRTRGSRLTLTAGQLAALGECVDTEVDDPAECVLLDHQELARIGLDLPEGTVELRQGDSFVAIAPDGAAVESS